MKFAAIIAIACLATGASAFWFGFKKEIDFEGLNRFLVGELQNNNEPSANVDLLKSKVGQLKEPLKKTAELVIKLAGSEKCNYDEIEFLIEINGQSLKVDGQKRIEKVLSPYVTRTNELCTKFIDDKVAELSKFMHKKDAQFTVDFWRHTVWDEGHFLRAANHNDMRHLISTRELLDLIRDVAKNDPEADLKAMDELTGKPSVPKRKAAVTYAFDEYVGKPCSHIYGQYKLLFEGSRAVVQLKNSVNGYSKARTQDFRRIIWTSTICGMILNKWDHYEQELQKAVV